MNLNSLQAWSFSSPMSLDLFGLSYLVSYKLEIITALFALVIAVTVGLFVMDRAFRQFVEHRLSTSTQADETIEKNNLLAKIPLFRWAFIVSLASLFLFLLVTYQHYTNQIYTMVFATGIFILNLLGTYFFGSLKRTQQTEQLVNKLHLHIQNTEEAQEKLLTSERRLQRQNASLASLAAMQLNKKASPKVFMRQLIRQSAETLQVGRVSVWIYDKGKQVLECDALYELATQSFLHGQTPMSAEHMPDYFALMAESRVITVDDALNDSVKHQLETNYLQDNNISSLLDATIWQDDEMLGVICHEHTGEARHWRLDEQNYVGSLADLARLSFELYKRQTVETDLIEHKESFEAMVLDRTASIENNAKLFRFLVERAPVTILYMNAANEILEMNPEAERISGYTRDFAIGKTYQSLFVPEDTSQGHMHYFNEVMLGNTIQGQDLTIRCADGSTIDLSVSRSMELDAEGNPVIISIGQDITQKKALEASLIKAREAAEAADRIKSMFVASMSHELRTPLNSIIGFIGVVLQGMSGSLNDKQHDQLNRAYFSAKHLLSLISDVIDISKIEAGYLDVYEEQVNLTQLLSEVQHTVNHLIQDKELIFTIKCADNLNVHTDRKRLFQVVLNVVSNALKYTEQGFVKVLVSTQSDHVVIEVEDTGIGIDEAGLNKLFQPFERIDSHLKIKTLGTGLGLHLTNSILSLLLGGNIQVESTIGKGSIFAISVPYNLPKSESVPPASILE